MISGNGSVNLRFTPFNCSLADPRYELIYHQLHPDNSPTALKSFSTWRTGNVSRCRIRGLSKFTQGYESTSLVSRPNTPSITGCRTVPLYSHASETLHPVYPSSSPNRAIVVHSIVSQPLPPSVCPYPRFSVSAFSAEV
jgi:hypothetical protein